MKLTCGRCSHSMEIDDSRLPSGKSFKVKCPKCTEAIIAKAPEKQQAYAAEPVETAPPAQAAASFPTTADPPPIDWERVRPFVEAYVNQKIAELKAGMEPGNQNGETRKPATVTQDKSAEPTMRALLVENNVKIAQTLASSLSKMGYSLESVKTVNDALAKIEANNYELIATSPAVSGAASILARINARKFEERRRTFVVLVSTELETSGPENAFIHGANLTVNTRDLKDLEQLILRGHQEFHKLSH